MRRALATAALIAAAACGSAAAAQDFDIMGFADTDKDGKVSSAEYAAMSEQGWGFFSQGADKVKVADLDPMAKGAFNGITPDATGFVTKDAYTAAIPGRFKTADKNADGSLDKAELEATMAPPAG